MHKTIFSAIILLLSIQLYSQNQHQYSLGLGAGINSMIQDKSIRGAQYDGETFNTVEFRYAYSFKTRFNRTNIWAIETGFTYSLHEFWAIDAAGIALEKSNIAYVPIYGKYKFSKFFYFSTGLIYTFELNAAESIKRSEQNGFGIGFEVGMEYPVSRQWLGQITAFARQHSILNTIHSQYSDAMTEFGVKLALAYQI